jgi:hypothetical protein
MADLAVSEGDIDIKWELSQILPYRGANRAQSSGISATHCPNVPLEPLTAPARPREIIKELI